MSRPVKTTVAVILGCIVSTLLTGCDPGDGDDLPPPSGDSTLIYNALIIDGTGTTARRGAVRIARDSIVDVGDLSPIDGEQAIDARGLVLAPGFIDTHSHHDDEGALRNNPDALPLLTQGITTSVFGQDGGHHLPLADFLSDFDREPAAVNIASYVGHNTIRERVMGNDAKRPANPEEVEAMRSLLLSELQAGALGLSTGLEYEPGIYSRREEVLALAAATAAQGGRYISHVRSEDRFLWDAMDEIIDIGRQTGIPVQISHIKLAAKKLWNQAPELLEKLDAARAEGIDITADVYPYEYWASTMWVLLPDRDADNLEEIAFVLDQLTPASGIIFTRYEANPDYVNQSVAEIAKSRGTSEVQTFSDLLKESEAWSEANGGASAEMIMGRSMTETDIETFLRWEHSNVCSDGGFTGHPRGHGSFPRVLARYVRDRQTLSLETAVAAMTSRAANHMGFADRGRIAPGMKADLVLFDPESIQDHAGIRDGQVLSTGVDSVWVNGQRVLKDGESTQVFPGQVLRRSSQEGALPQEGGANAD
ncbi:N-acyl-D-aspartate/D-glutamate deacylase [Congregibacter litoralis KT71]|uniref:N-acyl-D-aspartate/D-glutamate deacylase n=2 Tax=Congregibacter TaxID=393661 RepID=A4AAZ5_9GAMM|nr:N-acyl-D-aspartate/D-glutamate deacylase [Congregibacter litoralis KT71]